jgi:hypothetical protein
MGVTAIERTTAEDLLRMPDDGYRREVVRGELRTMPPAGPDPSPRGGEGSDRTPLHDRGEEPGLGAGEAE